MFLPTLVSWAEPNGSVYSKPPPIKVEQIDVKKSEAGKEKVLSYKTHGLVETFLKSSPGRTQLQRVGRRILQVKTLTRERMMAL